MTKRQWSLFTLLILVNYIIFSQLFARVMDTVEPQAAITRTPNPTFTATPIIPTATPTETPTPVPPTPTPTNTSVMNPPPTETPTAGMGEPPPAPATATPVGPATGPVVTAQSSAVNLRRGPGVNYPRVGTLLQGQSLAIVGRNAAGSWWQVSTEQGVAWISASVTQASNTDGGVPVASAPPPPAPVATATPVPVAQPTAAPPAAQYTIRNVFGQLNEAITQIRGEIRDTAGNPVSGARVRVRSGSFCTVSYPSGAPGGYPGGNYDILLDTWAKPGDWQVAVVNGPANLEDTSCNDGLQVLSEEISVQTTPQESVIFIEWVKNW